jgi:DNA helicase-2/ATP-dependent DNA helicase PcrA
VVLAGPGSGKTKTLTIKMARILAEDVQEPRGVACITYNKRVRS